ncbi:lysophospholipid acyltransferase family protein [Ilumatobacter sp.]|uniref:lysophospholipid acyltransferase family protein n=1 Tax=Ilumatobacter sp. TaxID=1967498 RepID=UPI003C6938C2
MKSKAVQTVLSIWGWFVLGVSVLLFTPVVAVVRLVTMPFDKGAYAAGYTFRKVVVPLTKLNPLWTFHTSGTLPDDMRRPYVVVANHESFVDMLLISHLPTEMKWLSKVEIMKLPFMGWMMRLSRDIPLVRGEKKSAVAALDECRERLSCNVSVMIFPEGSRSNTGDLNPFAAGAFKLAIEGQYPILPMAVHGTRDCLRKNDWRQGRAVAEVRVLEPIPTAGLTKKDLPELRDRVRALISDARDDLRAEHGWVEPPRKPDSESVVEPDPDSSGES